MSPIFNNALAGASGQGAAPTPTPYSIDRSVRFNSADSAYLSRVFGSPTDAKKQTYSFWVKRTGLGQIGGLQRAIINAYTGGSTATGIYFDSDSIQVNVTNASDNVKSTAVFRDASAWYHFVVAVDTTQITASNRVKIYANRIEITSFSVASYPALNAVSQFANSSTSRIGTLYNAGGYWYDGLIAEFHFIDGQALDPTSFGEYDSNNVWQPKEYTGTYGTNGFHLDFTNNSSAAALGEDSSGNGNDWTANNLTSSIDILPAVEFGGNSSDYLSIGNDSSLTFGSGDFTIEAWMNFDTAGNYTLVEKGSDWSFLSDNNRWAFKYGNTNSFVLSWTPTFGEWYHVACVRNGSTVTLYIDGQSIGSGPAYTSVADTGDLVIGTSARFSGYVFDGYVSNLRIVKGTALYTSNFTPPTTPLSAVTNTSLLCCQSSTDATDAAVTPGTITANGNVSATLKNDTSPDNDSFVDSPTNGTQTDTGAGGEVAGNYATLNPLDLGGTGCTLSNGNLEYSNASGNTGTSKSTIAMTSGKWYCECVPTLNGDISLPGILNKSNGDTYTYYAFTGNSFYIPGSGGLSQAAYGASYSNNDVVGIAYDADSGDLTFYKNGTSQGVISTGFGGDLVVYYFSDGSSNALVEGTVNFGQRPFAYAAPVGYKALCTANLPIPTIADGSDYFDTTLYTGNGSTQSITGLNFSPDLVWIKNRAAADSHKLTDTVRGATEELESDTTAAEATNADGLTAFNSDGFDLGADAEYNTNTETYVAWAWDAGSSTVSNTDGSITSSVRVNTSAGFSVVTAGAGGYFGGTVGHGLGVAPDFIILKDRNGTTGWRVYHSSMGDSKYGVLSTTDAFASFPNLWNVSSTTFGSDKSFTNTAVAYCWSAVEGYSDFGTYTGNGSADGPFVYTGFRPAFVMIKRTDAASLVGWYVWDSKRGGYNVQNNSLNVNTTGTEYSATATISLLSNGFKLLDTYQDRNANSGTYIYAAFAEHPFRTARAR